MRRFSVLMVFLAGVLMSTGVVTATGSDRVVVKVAVADRSDVTLAASVGEPWEVNLEEGFLILDVSPNEYQTLLDLGFELDIDVERTQRLNTPLVPLEGQTAGIPGYPCYRTVEETLATGAALAAAYPSLASWADIGDSWEKTTPGGAEGFDLMVLKLTNSAVSGDKPDLWVEGAIHAREYATAETATRFAEHLLDGYGVDPDITWLLDWHEIHILLQTNPDGRKRAETGLSWRKNTDNDDGCGSSSDWGTDLNRNFDFYWGCCGGSSADPCATTYRGPGGSSEPESAAVQSYLVTNFPDFRPDDLTTPAPDSSTGIFLDLHSYGGDVLSVFGFQDPPNPPNGPDILLLGRRFSHFNGYYARLGSVYPVDGSTKDWAYGRLGIPAYTIELGSDFFEPCSSFEATVWPDNLDMLVYAAKAVAAPYVLPEGPDVDGVSATPILVAPGDPVTIQATADDTQYGPGDGTMTSSVITAAEYYIDIPPWAPGAVAVPLAAADGTFNSTIEGLVGTLDTTGIEDGRHTIFCRARDASGAWGMVSAAFTRIQDPATAPHIVGAVTEQGTGLPLAATVTAGIYSTTTNPADGSYDLMVISGTYDVEATADQHVADVQTGVTAVGGSSTTVDFDLAAWPHIVGVVIEQGTGLPLAATISAGGYQTTSSAADGSYDLVLAPGSYSVSASAPEHGTVTYDDVVAVAGAVTFVDFELRPMATLLDDDVESGNIGWTVDSALPGGTNWSIVVDGAPNHAWYSSDADGTKDDRLVAGPFAINEGAVLTFDHHWMFEGTSTFWDGGVLEISFDGVNWDDVLQGGVAFVSGGYTGTLTDSTSNPLGSRQAWTGDSPGVVHTEVDLSPVSQTDLWIRFRLGCDSTVGDEGWYVDNILLRTTVDSGLSVFLDDFESGSTSAWSQTVPAPPAN